MSGGSGGVSGGGAISPPAYYPGPPYWDPARDTYVDPLTGQPVRGGGR